MLLSKAYFRQLLLGIQRFPLHIFMCDASHAALQVHDEIHVVRLPFALSRKCPGYRFMKQVVRFGKVKHASYTVSHESCVVLQNLQLAGGKRLDGSKTFSRSASAIQ